MDKDKIKSLVKSNVLLGLDKKKKLLSVIDKADDSKLKELEQILNDSDLKLKEILKKNLNSENIDDVLRRFSNIKSNIAHLEEKKAEKQEEFLEEQLLSELNDL